MLVARQRHFTVTAFVSRNGATLLHWHRKVGLWLPPGGHIEAGEDPIEAALREVMEETGMAVEIAPTAAPFGYGDPPQLPAPATIMIEPIRAFGGEQAHQHIDLIYFTRPLESQAAEPPPGWRWISRADLAADTPIPTGGADTQLPEQLSEDVRVLGLAAIDHIARLEAQP